MSIPALPGIRPVPSGTRPDTASLEGVRASAEKFPRPNADPQDDWPPDIHLPDEREDDEC
jgi:hypothetical protein